MQGQGSRCQDGLQGGGEISWCFNNNRNPYDRDMNGENRIRGGHRHVMNDKRGGGMNEKRSFKIRGSILSIISFSVACTMLNVTLVTNCGHG